MFRYLTPTEDMEKREGEVDHLTKTESSDTDEVRTVKNSIENESVVVETTNVDSAEVFSCLPVDGDVSNKENISDNETVIENSEAVPIVENSAVSVELEPSNNESSLSEKNVQQSDNDSKLDKEGAVNESEEAKVPPVENISTISQFCDPSHYNTSTANAATHVVVNTVTVNQDSVTSNMQTDVPQKHTDVTKRRVSLPTNHTESQTAETNYSSSVQSITPQKRPRSASTSTQVDPNLFGKSFLHNRNASCCSVCAIFFCFSFIEKGLSQFIRILASSCKQRFRVILLKDISLSDFASLA